MPNFKIARERAGMSQKEVALTLKVSPPTVSEWESGKISPTAANLKALAKMYDVTIDYLLSENPDFIFIDSKTNISTRNAVAVLIGMYNINAGVIAKIANCSLKTAKDWDMGKSSPNDEQKKLLANYFELDYNDFKVGKLPLFPHINVFRKVINEIAPLVPGTLSKEAETIAVRYDKMDDRSRELVNNVVDYIEKEEPVSVGSSAASHTDAEIALAFGELTDSQSSTPEVHQK